MGRPLHKRFFGNRNLGSASTTADEGIGGSRVASVTITTPGSYTTAPTVTFDPPALAGVGAVTATGTVNMEALSATVNAGGLNYVVGDLLTITGAGGAIAYVASVDGVTGAVLTVNFTGTGAVRGTQTNLTGITVGVATTGGSGDGNATLDVLYRVASVTMTEKGSGYSTVADALPTFSAGAAVGAAVLEVDGTGIYEAGTNENAITISAFLPTTAATGLISGAGGAAAKNGDIQAQHGSRRYIVETADGVGIVKLVAAAPAAGEATITAEDSAGGTYYVIKLTAHRATLVPNTGVQFGANESVPWTFGNATLNTTVKIQNT